MQTKSSQGEVILTLADEHRSRSADGQEHIYTINRPVFFKSDEDVDGIVVGDIITVKGKPNGYSLFQGSVEK